MNITNYIASGFVEGYIFGLLNEEETQEFEALLAKSSELKAELERIQNTINDYATIHEQSVNPQLKEQIWNKIQSQNTINYIQEPAKISEELTNPIPVTEKITPPIEEIKSPIPEPEKIIIPEEKPIISNRPKIQERIIADTPTETKKFRLAPWFAAASFIGMMVSSYLAYDYYNHWQIAEDKILTLNMDKNELAEQLNVQKTSLADVKQYNEMFRKPSMKFIELQGKPIAPNANCIICWDKKTKEVMITYTDMPTPPEGKQYQLWGILDGKPINLGVIDFTKANQGIAHMNKLEKAQAFAITLEKTGGNESPTLDQMYLFGNI